MATSKVWLITGAGRRSRWPQRFGSRLTLTVSCPPPWHTTMRPEHRTASKTWLFRSAKLFL